MTLIRFTDAQLHELMQAARMVRPDLRDGFLERVAADKPLGDGLVLDARPPALTAPPRRAPGFLPNGVAERAAPGIAGRR
jgi:hypothetical protein